MTRHVPLHGNTLPMGSVHGGFAPFSERCCPTKKEGVGKCLSWIKLINIWFYVAAVDIWNFVLMNVWYGRHYHSFSLKNLFTLSGEGVMWVTSILFYETNLNKKWKMKFFHNQRGTKGKGKWCHVMRFLHWHDTSFSVRINFSLRD